MTRPIPAPTSRARIRLVGGAGDSETDLGFEGLNADGTVLSPG